VVNEVNGVWRKAITLNESGVGDAEVSAVACASPGNCIAAGRNGTGGTTKGLDGSFVVNEARGRWRKPITIPGKLTFVYGEWIQSASCPSPGNCAVGGWYQNGAAQSQAFVASEVKGAWRHYIALPGTIPPPGASGTQVASVSCPKPGNCTVAGNVIGGAGFLASEVNGIWHKARSVPGLINIGGSANGQLSELSCPTAGNCSAAGSYTHAGIGKGFVVNEINGVWHNAINIPGMGRLDHSGNGFISALSCSAPGNCSAGGRYLGPKWSRPFVVNEINGIWRNASEVRGMAALSRSGSAQVTALSCPRASTCSAGGYYGAAISSHFDGQVFVVTETAR